MPDPPISDDELDRRIRAYLHHRRAEPVPPGLEAKAIAAARSPRRKRALLLTTPLLAGVTTLVVVAGILTAAFMLNRPGPAASGGPPPSLQKSPAPTTAPSPSSSPTYVPPGVTPAPTPLPLVGPRCTANDLAVRAGPWSGAGDHGYTLLVFTDHSSSACVLDGTPTVQFIDASGATLNSPSVVDTNMGYFPPTPNAGVGLRPIRDAGATGAPALVGQAVLPFQYYPDGCTTAISAVRVTLAGGGTLIVDLQLPPQQLASAGQCGVVDVNPFQPPAS